MYITFSCEGTIWPFFCESLGDQIQNPYVFIRTCLQLMKTNPFLLAFFLWSSCFSSTLDSIESTNTSSSASGTVTLFKDSISNHYKFIADDKVYKLDYIGDNYEKLLDSNSYEFKQIMNYKATKIVSVFSFIGLSTTVIITLFNIGTGPSIGLGAQDGTPIPKYCFCFGTFFGVTYSIFDIISIRILNNIINNSKINNQR